jgi:hypothetical protein
MLKDSDASVRDTAAEILGGFAEYGKWPILSSGKNLSISTESSQELIKDAIPLLVDMLKDFTVCSRLAAVRAFTELAQYGE